MEPSILDETQVMKDKFLDMVENPKVLKEVCSILELGYGNPLVIRAMVGYALAMVKERDEHREALKAMTPKDL